MSRPSIHISIPQPCHESLDRMGVTARGAFCHRCQKEVVDFNSMTDREVVEYLEKHQTGCGRFRMDQLDTKLTAPAVDNGVLRWRALFISFLSFFVAKSAEAFSHHYTASEQISMVNKIDSNTLTNSQELIVIKGKVLGENEEGLIGASILIIDSLGHSTGIGVSTDFNGMFTLSIEKNKIKGDIHQFKVINTGYKSKTVLISYTDQQNIIINLSPELNPPDTIKIIRMGKYKIK